MTNQRVAISSRLIMHFTHVDNLRSIAETGRLVCDAAARQSLTATEVGDQGIKQERRGRPIPLLPGGNVGEYVPFYFAHRSPMLYRISCDHRDRVPGRYPDGDTPLIYLVSTIGAVVAAGVRWIATDGNAATATTTFTDSLEHLDTLIDWDLMVARR